MATAGILQAQDVPTPFLHEIMEASNIQDSPRVRHGRGKSFSKGGRARGLSNATPLVNEREASLTKGLNWILRHREDQDIIELDEAGFAGCSELLKWQYFQNLNVSFPELQALLQDNTTARHRFSLKLKDNADSASEEASDWLLGSNQSSKKKTVDTEIMANLKPITLAADNVPEVVVFQTTYAAYPLILASGNLENASANYIHFSAEVSGDAEVLIYINVQKALEEEPSMLWFSGEGKASIVTSGDKNKAVSSAFWKKVVGRKNEVGLLWENGEQIKEVPVGLRGKKVAGGKSMRGSNGREKGKAGKEAGLRRNSLDTHSEEELAAEAVDAVKQEEGEE